MSAAICGIATPDFASAFAYLRIGDVLVDLGKHEEAMAAYSRAREVIQKLAELDSSHAQWQGDLAEIHLRIGTCF
jgi:predicted negative regulator of RcsB-dependent stress response